MKSVDRGLGFVVLVVFSYSRAGRIEPLDFPVHAQKILQYMELALSYFNDLKQWPHRNDEAGVRGRSP